MIRRILSLVSFAALGGTVFAANPTPAEQQLQQKIVALQKDLQLAVAQNQALKNDIAQGTAKVAQLQSDLKKAKGNDTTDDKTIQQLKQQVTKLEADSKNLKTLQTQVDSIKKAKFAHTIVYKAKADTNASEHQSLADDANLFFATVKSVRGVWAGKASADVGSAADYQVVIVLLFDDLNGYQTFQKDPQWTRFTDKHAKLWEDPKFYDLLVGK